MTFKSRYRALLLGGAFAGLLGAAPARADIVTSLFSSTAVAGGYRYVYNVDLVGGQLDAVQNGMPLQFGTIYDFGSILQNADGSPRISYTGLLSNFTWTFNASDTPAPQTAPNDNPGLTNIRFIYNGTANLSDGRSAYFDANNIPYTQLTSDSNHNDLGTFSIDSPYGPTLNTASQYDGTTFKSTNNSTQANVGFLSTPQLPSDVPEPATLALLGSALVGVAGLRRRK